MKLYRDSIDWPFLNSEYLLLAATGPSTCHRPRQGLEAQRRKPSANSDVRRSTECIDESSEEQEWAVRTTNDAALP